MPPTGKAVQLPRDKELAAEVRAAVRKLSPDAFAEVDHVVAVMKRFGADRDDQIAIFNNRYEVLAREVPGGIFVLLVRDARDDEWTLVDVSLRAPQGQTAAERCARALGTRIQSLHIT